MQIGLSHTGGAGAAGGGTVLADPLGPPLTAPVRNRYFYGKLLDVHHLELEQRYFVEYRRRLNRLTVGYGVVCGLEVSVAADGKGVIVAPGFAIDGVGREILVTEPICLADPSQLTDDCGRPAGTAEERVVTLCLAYHECPTEPVPVLVSDCDVREGCAPGAIRERYALLVHDGIPETPPYTGIVSVCHELAERLAGLGTLDPGRGGTGSPMSDNVPLNRKQYRALVTGPQRNVDVSAYPSVGGWTAVGERAGCDPPDETCVVLAIVAPPQQDGDKTIVVDQFVYRRTLLSNDELYEAVLCLAAAVDRCCGKNGATRTIDVESGDDQTGDPGSTLAEPVVVRVSAGGSPVKGATVSFTDTSDNPGTLSPATRKTDANGEASSSWTVGGDADKTWTARASITDSVYADLTANPNKD